MSSSSTRTLVRARLRATTASSPEFMGDGVLAYFGFPRAHEDDAERAVLEPVWMWPLWSRKRSTRGRRRVLRVRNIGIATGIVTVVGDLVGLG